jgi:Family of unknown function (DUF6732)
MRPFAILAAAMAAVPAEAHPGHVARLDGHSHWLALGLAMLGLAGALWSIRAGRGHRDVARPDGVGVVPGA